MIPFFALVLIVTFAALFVAMTSMAKYQQVLGQCSLVQFGSETIAVDSTDGTEYAFPAPPPGNAVWGVVISVTTTYTATAAEAVVASAVHLDSAISKVEYKFSGEIFQINNSAAYRWLTILQQAFNKTAITSEALAGFDGAGSDTATTRVYIPFHSRNNGSIKVTAGAVTAAYAADVRQSSVFTYSVLFGQEDDPAQHEWGIDTVTLPAINGAGTFHDKVKKCRTDLLAFAGLTEAQFTSLLLTDENKIVQINALGADLIEKGTQQGQGLARITNSMIMPLPGEGGVPIGDKAYMVVTTSASNAIGVAYVRLLGALTIPQAPDTSGRPPVSITPQPSFSTTAGNGRPSSRMRM